MKAAILSFLILSILSPFMSWAQNPIEEDTQAALHKAVKFFNDEVSIQGGYLWKYSADLSKREGEGKVEATTAWLQPPGTPFVGEALLDLYDLTSDTYFLDAAKNTAMALVKGQLHSGGWDQRIEFAPEDRKKYAYRIDGEAGKKNNRSTLDDDKTQSALRFLMRYDKTTGMKDETVHEAVIYGLDKLCEAQFPNGGWGHAFISKPNPALHPVMQAGYREDGEYSHKKEYWEHYTLNDNLMSDVINTLILAVQIYSQPNHKDALHKAGGFLLLAQMPEPQPGWCQQYDDEMKPAWARKFEPPAVSGGESQKIMMTLLDLYELTGEEKYLQPIPKALRYYQSSLLTDGRLARFYELKTNKPLYFTLDYELTYNDDNMPTHYGFKVSSNLKRIEDRYNKIKAIEWTPSKASTKNVPNPSPQEVKRIIDTIDERGAWVEDGRLRYWGDDDPTNRIIDPRTFAKNTVTLVQYLHHLKL